MDNIDLVILDNLSTLFSIRSESSSEAWAPIQEWLLTLRRRGVSVLFIHHAGTNGRQRGTSRREDILDVVIGLKRPENYSPENGARFQVHFEKLRGRVENGGAISFEAAIEAFTTGGREGVEWISRDLTNPLLEAAADLFREGQSVRQVAEALGISKSEGGRIRLRLIENGALGRSETDEAGERTASLNYSAAGS
jgi:putative DNA primase/helicase